MNCPGLPWVVQDYHGLSRIAMNSPGLPWVVLGYHGLSRIAMNCPGLRWVVLECHELSQNIPEKLTYSVQRYFKHPGTVPGTRGTLSQLK